MLSRPLETDSFFQVEYAVKAVENGGTCIGIRCKDGVVLAVEKIITSKLLKPGANKRIAAVDRNFGVVSAHPWAKRQAMGLEYAIIGIFRPGPRWSAFCFTSTRRGFIMAVYIQSSYTSRCSRRQIRWLRSSIHPLLKCQAVWCNSHSRWLGLGCRVRSRWTSG